MDIKFIKFINAERRFLSLLELIRDEDIYNLFIDYDPIRPPKDKNSKPIIYIDILEMFAKDLNMKVEVNGSKYKLITMKDEIY